MHNRRAFFLSSAVAVPAVLGARRSDQEPAPDQPRVLPIKDVGPSACYFPNVPVVSQHGVEYAFYDDLVRNRVVFINFMSIRGDAHYPVTGNLAKVQALLGDQVGRDMWMLSITVDPEHDTPERLQAFAEEHGAGPGWLFLTGRVPDLDLLRANLFVRRADPTAPPTCGGHGPGGDCSVGLARYGAEALGRWGSVPTRITPESIAKRFTWVGLAPPGVRSQH